MGILKNKPIPVVDNAAAAPAFEQEDDSATAGTPAVETKVKAVTRGDVAGKVEQVTKTENVSDVKVKEEEKSGAEAGAQDEQSEAGTQAAQPVAAAKTAIVLARTDNGTLKTFLNNGTGGMVNPLKDLENAFAKAGMEVEYSTFPRLRVDSGCIATPEGKEAGDFVELQVISYAPSWTVATGTDGDEGKKHVRFSDDGIVTNPAGDSDEFAGTPLADYVQHLKILGFEKASVKEYQVVYGLAVDSQEAGFAHLNELCALSLAPQSKKKFDSYIINRAIQAKMGRIQETSGNPVVRWSAERVKGKDNKSYFNLIPSHGKTAPVDLT